MLEWFLHTLWSCLSEKLLAFILTRKLRGVSNQPWKHRARGSQPTSMGRENKALKVWSKRIWIWIPYCVYRKPICTIKNKNCLLRKAGSRGSFSPGSTLLFFHSLPVLPASGSQEPINYSYLLRLIWARLWHQQQAGGKKIPSDKKSRLFFRIASSPSCLPTPSCQPSMAQLSGNLIKILLRAKLHREVYCWPLPNMCCLRTFPK